MSDGRVAQVFASSTARFIFVTQFGTTSSPSSAPRAAHALVLRRLPARRSSARQGAHHQKIFYLWRPFLRDPNDDMVLEVAVEAQCSYIVTFNTRDFAGIEQFGLQTLTPGEFLALLQEDA